MENAQNNTWTETVLLEFSVSETIYIIVQHK